MADLRKSESHGRIGEAATYAKCWMNGIRAYHTGGLRLNFAGSDLIVETKDPRQKLWIQVKAGAPTLKGHVYLTQCAGDKDLNNKKKFAADFVIFVNLDPKMAKSHLHDGSFNFEHLSFYIVPCDVANNIYRKALNRLANKPKRDGGRRKLGNMAIDVPAPKMDQYRDAWSLIRQAPLRVA